MRWTITLLWCLAAAAAMAGALLLAQPGDRRARETRLGLRPLLDEGTIDPEAVDEIAISRPGGQTLTLRREGDGWIEASPSGLPVDPFAVRDLIDTVRGLQESRRVAGDGADASGADAGGPSLLQALELDPPAATLSLRSGSRGVLLRLGRVGLAGRAFVQVVEDGPGSNLGNAPGTSGAPGRPSPDVAVVGQELHALLLGQDPSQWRLRALFPEAGVETRRIEYAVSGTTLRVLRSGATWRMESPVSTRVDEQAMSAWLAALARAECDGFLGDASTPERLELAGLVPPVASIQVASGGAANGAANGALGGDASGPAADDQRRDRTLVVGRTTTVGGSDRFGMLQGHPALLSLSQATLQTLFAAPAALIDPRACAVLAADIKRIRIEGPDGTFTVERDLDRWRSPDVAAAPGDAEPARGAEVDLLRVNEFLRRLLDGRASAVNLNPIPRELLIGRIDLIGFDGAPLASIEVGADAAGANMAFDSGDGVARIFPTASAPSLDRAALGLPIDARPKS